MHVSAKKKRPVIKPRAGERWTPRTARARELGGSCSYVVVDRVSTRGVEFTTEPMLYVYTLRIADFVARFEPAKPSC